MTYAHDQIANFLWPRWSAALDNLRARIAHHRDRRAAYRRTFAELEGYTQRELSEIGLRRSDIPTLARQAADMV